MSKERLQPSEHFTFTEHEKLWERISDARFRTLLNDPQTTVHKAAVDTNNYGEFLFITLSRPQEGRREVLTFFGYGYHEHRERWYSQEWAWYQANPISQTLEQQLTRKEVKDLLAARREEIAPNVDKDTQTARGKLFEMLADLTDDDGAIGEIDDLGDLWDDLGTDLE